MFEQLAKQLFDFEEFKASFEKMVNDKIAELHEQAVGGVAEQIEKIQAAKENVMQMYADLEAVTKKIGKAFAALFDMTAALKVRGRRSKTACIEDLRTALPAHAMF